MVFGWLIRGPIHGLSLIPRNGSQAHKDGNSVVCVDTLRSNSVDIARLRLGAVSCSSGVVSSIGPSLLSVHRIQTPSKLLSPSASMSELLFNLGFVETECTSVWVMGLDLAGEYACRRGGSFLLV